MISAIIGIGYDLLKGNPDGDFNTGGTDPGYRLAHNIFMRTYKQKKTGIFNGAPVKIPDQIEYQPHQTSRCSTREAVKVFSGTKSYQKKLDMNIVMEASRTSILFDFRFSLSSGYSQVYNSVQTIKKVIMDETVVCSKATVLHKDYDAGVSNEFINSVKNLPLTYDEGKYIQFIKNWGTHFIDSATFGGRLTNRFESTQSGVYNFASENVKKSISSEGSYKGYSESFKLDINKLNQQLVMPQSSTSFGSKTATITSGSRIVKKADGKWEVPTSDKTTSIPIEVTLKLITEAFRKGMWSSLPGGVGEYDSLRIREKLEHLKKALLRYPFLEKAPRSSDPTIKLPNAWPDGNYSIPKPKYGCPIGGNSFTWKEGYILQDNEDTWNSNRCPSQFYFSGFCTWNLMLHYCTKTVSSKDYGIEWPKGSYCIGKKGNCPKGFSPGYILCGMMKTIEAI